jgi:hypothetical protein
LEDVAVTHQFHVSDAASGDVTYSDVISGDEAAGDEAAGDEAAGDEAAGDAASAKAASFFPLCSLGHILTHETIFEGITEASVPPLTLRCILESQQKLDRQNECPSLFAILPLSIHSVTSLLKRIKYKFLKVHSRIRRMKWKNMNL